MLGGAAPMSCLARLRLHLPQPEAAPVDLNHVALVQEAIEVKSGRRRDALPGMEAFAAAFRPARGLLVGGYGIALEEFLSRPAEHWLQP
jgi:hypothetical protein